MTRESRSSGFPTRSDTNQPVQSQKTATSLEFWMYDRVATRREKSKGNLNFFKVGRLSGNFTNFQRNLELLAYIREWSGAWQYVDVREI